MIYHTSDTIESIRKMYAENSRAVVYDHYECHKRIRTILNRVADIPSIACRSWEDSAAESINRWNREPGKLLYYRPLPNKQMPFPECDSVVFLECPIQYPEFERLAASVRKDIIIYRPPDWKLHEQTIVMRYPTSASMFSMLATIDGLKGRPLTIRMQQALDYSGYDPAKTSVFTAADIKNILSIEERQLRATIKYRFRGFYSRYEVYRPMLRPIDDDCAEMYDVLLNEPDLGNGWRMLRFSELKDGRVPEFKRYLKYMVKAHNVHKEPSIYLLTDGYKRPNYDLIDAMANVRRGAWFKMRNIVDTAPDYCSS